MKIDITPATESDRKIIHNMVSYYIYDFSEHMGWNIKTNGTFGGCDDLAEYWQTWHPETDEKDRWSDKSWQGFPYLIQVDDRIAGFALVRHLGTTLPNTFDMGEFFILRKFRRKSIGQHVAHTLFDKHQGNWIVRQMIGNRSATTFWRTVISNYTNGTYQETKEEALHYKDIQIVQRFKSASKFAL